MDTRTIAGIGGFPSDAALADVLEPAAARDAGTDLVEVASAPDADGYGGEARGEMPLAARLLG